MGVQPNATSHKSDATQWKEIDFEKAKRTVKKLQERIVQATKKGKWRKVKNLQRLLVHSRSAKIIAIQRVSSSKGSKTPGVDGVLWKSNADKIRALKGLVHRKYKAQALRRVYIAKRGGGRRMLGIPTMKDRAMQALYLQSLDPISETTADGFSYGFRRMRSCWDAREHIHQIFAKKRSAQWVLDADIEKCFDQLSHTWLLNHIPLPKRILKQWLKCGVMEGAERHSTRNGTPQGGVISPVLANMALDGLIEELDQKYVYKRKDGSRHTNRYKINAVRYADDFIISGHSKEFLEETILPSVKQFLASRGLKLSAKKTRIVHISEGFNFLGYTIRKFKDKLIIKPSKESIKGFKTKAKKIFQLCRGLKCKVLVDRLNALINGWGRYFRTAVSKRVFSSLDSWLFCKVLYWGRRRQNKWGLRRIYDEYIQRIDFRLRACPGGYVIYSLANIPIRRHPKTPIYLNPYDPTHYARLSFLLYRRKKLRFPNSLMAG